MTPAQAISILESHNKWRCGAEMPEQDPAEIGTAIDLACRWLKKSMHIPRPKMNAAASESNCGKVRYPDKKAAVSAINFRRQFRGAPQELRAYSCPDCGGWHMTKKP